MAKVDFTTASSFSIETNKLDPEDFIIRLNSVEEGRLIIISKDDALSLSEHFSESDDDHDDDFMCECGTSISEEEHSMFSGSCETCAE